MRFKLPICFVLIGTISLLAGCRSGDPLPSTDNNFYALTAAVHARSADFDESALSGPSKNVAIVDAVYRAAIEDDLGYSFDATLRDTIIADDLNRAVLRSTIEAIGDDPEPFLKAGVVSKETAQLAIAYNRAKGGYGEFFSKPKGQVFLAHIATCAASTPNHLCTPSALRRILLASDPDCQASVRTYSSNPADPDDWKWGYRNYINPLMGSLKSAAYILTAAGQPLPDSQIWDSEDQPFQLDTTQIARDVQLWHLLEAARSKRTSG